jgi:hypothetical protein
VNLLIQERTSPARPRRFWSHDYFEPASGRSGNLLRSQMLVSFEVLMRKLSIAGSVMVAITACSVDPVTFTLGGDPPAEDCATAGDEDGNGAADCSDPTCAGAPSCKPTCNDGARNGAEADVDCGGGCAPCALGKTCAVDADCAAIGICDPQECRVAHSCDEILQHYPGSSDGAYLIAPTGAAPPFQGLCDMTRDGGGWTLLLKSGGDSALAYGAPAWTDDSLLNTDDLTTQAGNAKYESFLSLPVTTLRGELDGYRYTQAFAGLTAREIFAGPVAIVNEYPTFNTGALNWSTQPNCHTFGVNIPYSTSARFGWSANQENDCLTNDTAIGLGLSTQRGAGYRCGATECSAGNVDAAGDGLLWAK